MKDQEVSSDLHLDSENGKAPYIGVGTIYLGKYDPNGELATIRWTCLGGGGAGGGGSRRRHRETCV